MRGAVLALMVVPLASAQESKKWPAKTGLAFKTVEAGHGFEDLAALKKMIGEETMVVALGESTHGSREIFQMKHRLVEYLVTQMGFSIFSIEASMPEAYQINDYVEHGKGDLRELVRALHFWTWQTEEVLALVQWMRQFNASGKGAVRFTGFDMQTATVAAKTVLEYIKRVDARRVGVFRETYTKLVRLWPHPPRSGSAEMFVPIEAARGKTVRITSRIRTLGVEGDANIWVRADRAQKQIGFRNLGTGVSGTTTWTEHSVELRVPDEATSVVFGFKLSGAGRAWFDAGEVEIDGKAYSGINLEFEDKELEGLTLPWGTYSVRLDTVEPAAGKQCLRIERVDTAEPQSLVSVEAVQLAQQRMSELDQARGMYERKSTKQEFEWALQNARLITQCMQNRLGTVSRDTLMAENVKWIVSQNPGAKVILWAHNGHVARQSESMGLNLHSAFGNKYRPVGFATKEGTYRAWVRGKGPVQHNPLSPPPQGSIEAVLAAADKPLFIADLREAPAYIRANLKFRSIGAVKTDRQFIVGNVPEMFDLLVWIEKTSGAEPMK